MTTLVQAMLFFKERGRPNETVCYWEKKVGVTHMRDKDPIITWISWSTSPTSSLSSMSSIISLHLSSILQSLTATPSILLKDLCSLNEQNAWLKFHIYRLRKFKWPIFKYFKGFRDVIKWYLTFFNVHIFPKRISDKKKWFSRLCLTAKSMMKHWW